MTPDTAEPVLMAGAARMDVAGVALGVLRRGQGRPLLFLHGMDGLEGALDLIDGLSGEFQVLAPSHPGFGASALPADFDTVDDIAYLYLDLIEALDLRDVLVVGLSFGGWIAQEMLIKSRDRVSRLVLGAPLGLRTGDRRRQDAIDLFMLPMREAERLLQVTPCADADLAGMDEERLKRLLRNREAVSLYGWSPYLNDPKLRRRLHRLDVPTLVVWGADDRLIPPRYGEEYARALPDARLETIAACGHRIAVDRPDKLKRLISRFSSNMRATEAGHARLAV